MRICNKLPKDNISLKNVNYYRNLQHQTVKKLNINVLIVVNLINSCNYECLKQNNNYIAIIINIINAIILIILYDIY